MINRILITASFLLLTTGVFSQKGKVQTAWRSLTDYEGTAAEGKPDLKYLDKAKEAIDMALQNEDTKNKGKTHAYKARISYARYQYDLSQEIKRLETSVTDKNERVLVAYGNTALKDFEEASEEIVKIKDLDPKYMETIKESLVKGTSGLEDDDMKFALVAQQVKMESGNIASGKYKAKKYEEAADYFYKTAFMNTVLYGVKDTADFYNACIAAAKAKNNDKMLDYNKKMIEAKIGIPYNYESIYNVQLAKGDSAAALETLKKGRAAFPADMSLTNKETDYYLATGNQQQALANIKASIEKDPTNPVFYLISGQIYDALANPRDKNTGKDLPKPTDFEQLFRNAEASYLKGLEQKQNNKEFHYNLVFNLGALYNNYGGTMANRKPGKITEMAKLQKENEVISQEYYKKAIPYLEQSLSMKPDDTQTMIALRKLYLMTGNEVKGKEMNDRIKSGK
ncbi:MAG: hypothetical protein V4635_15530 [Bacteroidota bacterium]